MSYITPQEALARLQRQGMRKAKGGGTPLSLAAEIGDATPLYVFEDVSGNAILTTSDDELPTIIGECEANHLDDIPPAMTAWIVEAEREVADFQTKPKPKGIVKVKATTTSDTEPPKGRVSIAPLIKATWGQSAPYNDKLKFDGKASYVGCNAVAIGMILEYYGRKGYHRGCKGTSAYTTKMMGYKVPALPPVTVFDYANLTTSKPTTAEQIAAVSDMLRHIGCALKSDFAPNGTLAYLTQDVTVLKNYLRMGSYRILASNGYGYFEQCVYEELVNGRPVIMAGYAPSGAGHTFICDGYNASTDMYHFNWGWSGQCNGYFRLSALDITSARAYNSNKQAIIGIAPSYKLGDVNGDGEVSITDAMTVVEAAEQGSTDPKADVNSDGKVTTADANIIVEHIMGGKKL